MKNTKPDSAPSQVVFFDGVCGFCNATVDTLIRLDKDKTLRFAPLQGKLAQQQLDPQYRIELDTIIYLKEGITYDRSDAALHILRDIKGPLAWLASALLILPKSFRDFFYKLIAKYRYKLFGKRDTCRMPSPEERSRFIE